MRIDLGLGGILGSIGDLIEKAAKLAEVSGDEQAKQRVAELKRRLGKEEEKEEKEEKTSPSQETQDVLGGLFAGIGRLVDVATTLKATEQTGEFELGGGKKGMYSFGVRIGSVPRGQGQGEEFKVESFGHRVRQTPKGPVVEESREPEIDVIEEDDHILVVGDMPGVEKDDIQFEVKEQTLWLTTEKGRRYKKEVELPTVVKAEEAALSYKNGVLELKLPKS